VYYNLPSLLKASRDSAAGIATGYGLDDKGPDFESLWGQEFSLHLVQTGSEAHPASNPMGTEGSFPGVKRPGCEAHYSPPTSAEVKKTWVYISIPPYAIMTQCLIKHRDFTFCLLLKASHLGDKVPKRNNKIAPVSPNTPPKRRGCSI
jgi:hypothetical protein